MFKSQVVDGGQQEATGVACLLPPAEDQAILLHKISPVTAIQLVVGRKLVPQSSQPAAKAPFGAFWLSYTRIRSDWYGMKG